MKDGGLLCVRQDQSGTGNSRYSFWRAWLSTTFGETASTWPGRYLFQMSDADAPPTDNEGNAHATAAGKPNHLNTAGCYHLSLMLLLDASTCYQSSASSPISLEQAQGVSAIVHVHT